MDTIGVSTDGLLCFQEGVVKGGLFYFGIDDLRTNLPLPLHDQSQLKRGDTHEN
jgi:hypothetical protein